MVEILPLKLLQDSDGLIFGTLNLNLAKLLRCGLPVADGIVVTSPHLVIRTSLEHFNFGQKELFEQNWLLLKKEISTIAPPADWRKELGSHDLFLVNGTVIRSAAKLWQYLLDSWLEEIKHRLWHGGFSPQLAESLTPALVSFISNPQAIGTVHFDPAIQDSKIEVLSGKPHPNDLKKIDELVSLADKRLFMPHQYQWVINKEVTLVKVLPLASQPDEQTGQILDESKVEVEPSRSSTKVYLDLASFDDAAVSGVDGLYIPSEKVFDLNKPQSSYEELLVLLIQSAAAFEGPIFFKLADLAEGMGDVRGSLRLLHQKSLFDPLCEAIIFARNKHKPPFHNINLVIPFVRSTDELADIKKELSAKGLNRKPSLQFYLEAAVPENIVNLEEYLEVGIDGVVLNIDELSSFLGGFDHTKEELGVYKKQVKAVCKFLEEPLKILHKSKLPFMAYGSSVLNPDMLHFLVDRGVSAVVVDRFESHSMSELLNSVERRVLSKRAPHIHL